MLNKVIVTAYKLAGFVILSGILVGLASYVVMTSFYYTSSSWVAPVIISPSDKRVLELNAQLAQQQSLRDTLSAQKAELTTKLHDAERIVVAERAYQNATRASLKADLDTQRVTVAKLAQLRKGYDAAAAEIAAANEDFAGLSKERMREMFSARLTTRDEVVKGNMQLANLANANLGLSERQAMLDERVAAAQRQSESLALVEAVLRPSSVDGRVAVGGTVPFGPSGASSEGGFGSPVKVAFASGDAKGVAPTHDVLALQREFELSVLAMRRADESVSAIKQSVAAVDATLQRYDGLLKTIDDSPLLKAINQKLTVGFVPYTNMDNAKPGRPVYACKGNIVWCRRVGRVGETLEGEMTGSHPLQKVELRGVIVKLELEEARSAEEPVLHVGHAPFYF